MVGKSVRTITEHILNQVRDWALGGKVAASAFGALLLGADSGRRAKRLSLPISRTHASVVRDTVVLHLQVFVGSRTGVRKGVRAGHHHTLGSVITPL